MKVGIRCDAGIGTGAGHLIRCVALAEELVRRDVPVVFLGEINGPDWIGAELEARVLPLMPAAARPGPLAAQARALGLDVLVIDSYETDPACADAVRRAGTAVLAIVDGDHRGQQADVYLDQNLGAEQASFEMPAGSLRLAGADFVLLRDCVRRLRPDGPPQHGGGVPRILCFLGGTDAADAAPAVMGLAAATGVPFTATVVAARATTARALAAIELSPGQSLVPVAPTGRIAELASGADLAICASGSSVWELMCLGVPAALVHVADNQLIGYQAAVSRGLAAGLGHPARLTGAAAGAAVETLQRLLTDPGERMAIAARGHAFIDGRGRERVCDALLDAVQLRPV
ncbi:PseG/SpsG family protein [Actinomadura sp. 6N118]|uniref:PseG/SpsG family protein n=1 Tax=Actinomadura sp. 6N118 TaxID=3375151 RepID=UPI0037936CAE